KHWRTHRLQHAAACIGLEGNLHDTTPGPATERTPVAAGAPAKVLTASPTDLHPCLRRLADGSRAPTPEGSRPGFPWGHVAAPIRPVTGRRSLPPSSLTRSPIGSPCRSLSLAGATGLPRSAGVTERVRPCLWAGGASSAAGEH